jgi:GDP-4-dehydro-6-deoxy-D-mannose reductase
MSICLITGCEGFIGSHLADLLVSMGHEVHGTVYETNANLDHLQGKMTFLKGDMRDKAWIDQLVAGVKPDYVFHLAAQSFVTVSWEAPQETLETNVMGSFYLLEALKNSGRKPAVVVVGSSSVYGTRTEAEMPITEETSFGPTSMYAVSKVAEDMLGQFYAAAFDMKVVRVRPFNMTGPRKTDDACSDFSKGIVEVEKGYRDHLEVGNLDTIRDFTDGRDAVKALWLMAERGVNGEVYQLCSGTPRKMADVLDILLSQSKTEVSYEISQAKLRKLDDPIYVGSNAKLRALGWQPEIPFETSMHDALEHWRTVL